MAATERFVLPSDVVIEPIARLPAALREQVPHEQGDCAVTRPRTRLRTSVVDDGTAALLERFRDPTTIVDAVIAHSAAAGLDPEQTLTDAFDVLRGFVLDGLLVADGSELAAPIASALAPGDRVGRFELLANVQVLSDSEVHLARAADGALVAIKVARESAGPWLLAAFARERQVLAELDGAGAPRLLESGEHDGRPFLATDWCPGVDVERAAREARALPGAAGHAALLALAERTVAAYAALHARGVLHGDVHPRNAIAGPDGTVALIDFGLATSERLSAAELPAAHGGVDFFLDPESAAAHLRQEAAPARSAAAEQYAVAALLYLLLTGEHTQAFSLEPREMLRQLTERPPRPFAAHGLTEMRAVERVLARALQPDPAARWRSCEELLGALRDAIADDGRAAAQTPRWRPAPAGRELVAAVLARVAAPGELYDGGLPAPTASLMNGGAGIAYALLRLAAAREDGELLALADLWAMQATRAAAGDDAFYSEELEIVPEIFGGCSFFHHAVGVHGVAALVAIARGDNTAAAIALSAFVAAVGRPCDKLDVTFGHAGLLIGCALLLEALPPALDGAPLRAAGDLVAAELWARLRDQRPLAEGPRVTTLGAAHGWAGFLFGLLRWAEASDTGPPEGTFDRLDQLEALARPFGRGLRWSSDAAAPAAYSLATSWCNGAAGYVELWRAAARSSGETRHAALAERAAWTVVESGAVNGDLCCGSAGSAYALLGLHRDTGDTAWLARARRLAERAAVQVAADSLRRDSLYKGEIGVALLLAELELPQPPGMPAFAPELER